MITNVNSGVVSYLKDTTSSIKNEIAIKKWDAATAYASNDICVYEGLLYISRIDNNLNQNPITSSNAWRAYSFGEYNCVLNYALDGSNIYQCSYAGSLVGFTPVTTTGTTTDMGSWADSPFWMKEVYVCTLDEDGNERYILDPNNLTKDIYGNSIPSDELTTYDVMVHMPDVFVQFDSGKIALNSNAKYGGHKLAHTYGDEVKHDLYISMYNISVSDNKAHSFSGTTAAQSITSDNFRTYAKNKNINTNGWHLWNWYEYELYRAMVLQLCCNFNVQATIGQGLTTGSGTATMGVHNADGWVAGDISGTTTPVKCLIENPWGNRWQFIDDFVVQNGTDSATQVGTEYYANVYAGHNIVDNVTGQTNPFDNKEVICQIPLGTTATASGSGYLKTIHETPKAWGIYNSRTSAGSTTGLCDCTWWNGSENRLLLVGGSSGNDSGCGVFAFLVDVALSHARWNLGARLAYIK